MKSAESYKIRFMQFDKHTNLISLIEEVQKDAYNSGLQTAHESAKDIFCYDDAGLETLQCCIEESKKL